MRNQQEIHEAINAADDALIALRSAEQNLSGAGDWGIWDIMGGGLLSTFFKHNKLEQAQRELEKARSALRHFKDELSDLGRMADINLDIDGFWRFADYFFDDIFSDLMVQSKIRQSRQQVQQAIRQIESIRQQLWNMLG